MIDKYNNQITFFIFIFLKRFFIKYDKRRILINFLFRKGIFDFDTFLFFSLQNILKYKSDPCNIVKNLNKELNVISLILDNHTPHSEKVKIITSITSPLVLRLVYKLCNYFYLFKLSHIILNHYLKVLDYENYKKIIINNKISIEFEKIYKSILFNYEKKPLINSHLSLVKKKFHNLNNQSENLYKITSKGKYINKDFFDLVNNKKVAIIAPSKSRANILNEINTYDIVVRLNITSSKTSDSFNMTGNKVDVIYYRGEYSDNIINNLNSQVDVKSSFSVFKREIHMNKITTSTKNRTCRNFKKLFNLGSTNAVQDIVLDLMSFNPKKVKIFNTDLFLSGGTLKGYRPANLNSVNYAEMFSQHPPSLQFIILQQIFRINHNITGDEKLEKIIINGLQKYSNEMEKKWCN